jgi:hypothetical protein
MISGASRKKAALAWLCLAVSFASPATDLPYARLTGETIELMPWGMSFIIPQNWLDLYYKEHFNNLHLTREQLEKVRNADNAEWDGDYARIVNSVLPFENCAVHAGGDGWGKDGCSHSDVQMRVYVGNWSTPDVKKLIDENGFSIARMIADENRQKMKIAVKGGVPLEPTREVLKPEVVSEWHKFGIALPLWYDDYGGEGNVDFYIRLFGHDTVVLVFMYASGAGQAKFIEPIVASFK